jgi:hypothetical protein
LDVVCKSSKPRILGIHGNRGRLDRRKCGSTDSEIGEVAELVRLLNFSQKKIIFKTVSFSAFPK